MTSATRHAADSLRISETAHVDVFRVAQPQSVTLEHDVIRGSALTAGLLNMPPSQVDSQKQRQELQGAATVFGVGYGVGAALLSPDIGLLLGLVCAISWLQAGADGRD